jgi:hypothetical protein
LQAAGIGTGAAQRADIAGHRLAAHRCAVEHAIFLDGKIVIGIEKIDGKGGPAGHHGVEQVDGEV